MNPKLTEPEGRLLTALPLAGWSGRPTSSGLGPFLNNHVVDDMHVQKPIPLVPLRVSGGPDGEGFSPCVSSHSISNHVPGGPTMEEAPEEEESKRGR